MKRIMMFVMMAAVIWVAGCGSGNDTASQLNDYTVQNIHAEVTQGDFVYRLVTEKEEYTEKEPVVLYAELEYIGDQPSVDIYHAASPFYFLLSEKTRNYDLDYGMDQPLLSTKMEKGAPLRQEYHRSGGYSEQDEEDYIEFVKQFTEKGFLPGYYVMKGIADFYVGGEEDGDKQAYKLEAQVDFIVR